MAQASEFGPNDPLSGTWAVSPTKPDSKSEALHGSADSGGIGVHPSRRFVPRRIHGDQ